ncbi:hypothetical protein ABZY06_21930 [Streptomyces sp. NPDC006540]|jgi:hypothetical protein|uniref:hypothetical protein n=1 Tax=Streptomyces sp. NPDC006540 TaxID=3155353 RepID=UPI0033A763D3
MEDIDKGDLKPAPANELWNLDGRPAPMPNPARTLFMVALLENDNADPTQVTNQARTLLQGTLVGAWTNANNRTDLDEPGRFEFYVTTGRAAFESAIDTARGFSPPGAVLDPDDKLGSPQILRFTPDEHQRVLNHAPSTIHRTLKFSGDDASYDLTFTLRGRLSVREALERVTGRRHGRFPGDAGLQRPASLARWLDSVR